MKASGSTKSLMQGVSQQVPQDRNPGQHTEQVNMISDPVQGLSRRHGSRLVAETLTTSTPADLAAMIADTDNWRTFEYSNGGNEYVVLYRCATKPVGSEMPPVVVFNRTTSQYLTLVRPAVDANLTLLESGGCSAIAAIGKFVFMAGHSIVPTSNTVDLWGHATNQSNAVVWIRGGAYSRTFTITATKTDNTQVTFSYKTPTSSYPEVLDTMAISPYALDPAGGTQADSESAFIEPDGSTFRHELLWADWTPTTLSAKKGTTAMTNVYPAFPATNLEFRYDASDPRYVYFHSSNQGATDVTVTYTHQKVVTNPSYAPLVTRQTNAYNSAVTKWIGDAAEAIQPENIAQSLLDAATLAGLPGTRQASTIIWTNVKGLTVNDGGDGSLMRGVANEVTNIDQVSTIHLVGKVVKVRARNSESVLYLRATAKDENVTSGYTEVTWTEGAGVQQTITGGLVFGVASGSSFYLASSPTLLNSILPGDHPTYPASTCGDLESCPVPFFIGKTITYLGVFQDRLLVGAGAVVRCSRTADYLNFFQSSVVTIPADDPFEMLSQGSEDDVLRFSVLYDRDLVIFADKRQYVVSGRSILSPTSANMQAMSSHANAAQVPPLSVGTVIFYGQIGERASSVHQIQPGPISETTESYVASSQVDTYLKGNVIEIASHAKPTHLFVRTTGERGSVFCFTYLDKSGQGRVQDAWSRWDFNESLGSVIGMSRTPDGLLLHFLRVGIDPVTEEERLYIVADLCPLTTGLATYPYLDSIRTLSAVEADTGSVNTLTTDDQWAVVFDGTSIYQFIGDLLTNRETLIEEFPSATGPRVGALQPAYFTPTNPFVVDRDGKSITSGTLTVTALEVGLAKSSGFWADIVARQTSESQEYTARTIGDPSNVVGVETVTDMIQRVPIGLETRDYKVTFRARTWLPLTITTLGWVGQWFNRTQRF